MHLQQEIRVAFSPAGEARPEAVFDLSGEQMAALAAALNYYRAARFRGIELDAETTLLLRAVGLVCDQVEMRAREEAHGTLFLDLAATSLAAEASALYCADRDIESYQSPEERMRLALLHELCEPLRELAIQLRGAIEELSERQSERDSQPLAFA